MKDLFAVKVECYSGFKANEYPRCFYIDKHRIDVEEVIDRWYQLPSSETERSRENEPQPANYFKVRTADKKKFILKHEIKTDTWFLWIKGESMNLL